MKQRNGFHNMKIRKSKWKEDEEEKNVWLRPVVYVLKMDYRAAMSFVKNELW